MRTSIKIAVQLLVSVVSYAQQDSQFIQYMYNTININPAYAGSKESMNIFALHRTQWVGLDGAPVTNTVSINTPLNGSNLGLGISIINDKIGPSDENDISVDFSYTIHTSDRYKLSFGLKATANLLNIDFSKLSQYDTNDYLFQVNIDNKFSPNIGVGLYLYSKNTYFGLSAPNLLETTHFDRYANKGSSLVAREVIHYYFIAGHVFDLSADIKFKPSMLTKMVYGSPMQVDVSGNFMFNNKFVAGVAYRWSAAISAMVGFQATDSWFIGYGYDLETTRLSNYNSGSHELFLRYELFKKCDCTIYPRFL